jgi:putative hydrolase of the HAD superfamily
VSRLSDASRLSGVSRLRDVDAVLLDAGGVLVLPSHEPIAAALAEVDVAVEPGLLDIAHYAGMRGLDEAPEGPFDWRHYLDAYLGVLNVPAALRARARERLAREFGTSQTLWRRPTAGVHGALAALAAAGVRLGVVSNAEGTVEARLCELAICQVGTGGGVPVEVVVDSYVVGVEKPDPKIFGFALRAMGLDPARCLYLGDSVRIDVAGARAAGLSPVLVTPEPDARSGSFPRIRGVAELLALLG